MKKIPIGIDLGTTNTVAAYYVNAQIRIIEPSEGGRLTPSVVVYEEEGKRVVGTIAKRIESRNPKSGISEVKRLIGRKFDDPIVEKSLPYLSYVVERDANNDPVIQIRSPKNKITTTPQHQSALVLAKIGKDITTKFGHDIKKAAVITVPAYFNMPQREATLEAAKEAGFEVIKLLNEPTAAALDYFYEHPSENGDHFMVFDLGGGTFDVAILKKHEEMIEVLSVNGDSALGGHDFDNLIIDHVNNISKSKYKHDLVESRRDKVRLKTRCEEAKEDLSSVKTTDISLDGLETGVQKVELTRDKLEDMAAELFKRMMQIVESSLSNAKLSKDDIKSVILVGGSTRIKKISEMLIHYFGRDDILNKNLNADECVARGAALQAAMILQPDDDYKNLKIVDVVPLSIGISTVMNHMNVVIKRNTLIPHEREEEFCCIENKQNEGSIKVFEGERLNCEYNRLLGELSLKNLTPSLPGKCRLIVKMKIDQNGILHITAREKFKNNEKKLKIDYIKSKESESGVKNALKDAEDNKAEDKLFNEFVQKSTFLKDYCVFIRYCLEEKNLTARFKDIDQLCKDSEKKVLALQVGDIKGVETLTEDVQRKTKEVIQILNLQSTIVKNFLASASSDSSSKIRELFNTQAELPSSDFYSHGTSSRTSGRSFSFLRKAEQAE